MIIIGEKLNSSIPSAERLMRERDGAKLSALALRQAEGGAQYLDLNTAMFMEKEAEVMRWAIAQMERAGLPPEVGFALDSPNPAALREVLPDCKGRPLLINSLSLEKKRFDGMLELVMKQYTMMDAPTEMRPAEMGSLIEAISSYDNAERAIGYSYYYYARLMYNRENTKYIAVDGIEPNDETIQSGEYPFTTAYYAVMRKDTPADAPARKLLTWILSSDGQNTAKEASYVPVS